MRGSSSTRSDGGRTVLPMEPNAVLRVQSPAATWGLLVKTVAEYRLYAEECRGLVSKMAGPVDKRALETIARAWDRVADEREAQLLQQIDGRSELDLSS
jgi:hypothetical protein